MTFSLLWRIIFLVQPNARPLTPQALAAAWQQYVADGTLDPELDPLVVRSWQRSAPRLNPNNAPQWTYLSGDVLRRTLRQHASLLALARPLMEDVYQFIEGAGVVLLLTDNTHCVIAQLGDSEVDAELRALGIREGVFLDESRIGTNAFAVALTETSPAQIVGAEHFLARLQTYSTIAAPIFGMDGSPVAVLGLFQPLARHTPHALGMIVAAARALENQLSADLLMLEANTRASELNAALEAISDGVLAWDEHGLITHLNDNAGQLLDLSPKLVVGRPLGEYLNLPEGLARAVAASESVREIETSFSINNLSREFFASLRVIKSHEGAPLQYIVTLRPAGQVRQLVTRMVGAQARLTLDDIVGTSHATRRVRKQAVAAAGAKGSVLILGEEGTSKNVLARAIHNSSKRAAGPFLTLNCRAIPRDIVLTEFLGSELGALHAPSPVGQPSKFELADGGTLFLDQVEALSSEAQAALVRVIEFGEVIRLGGTRVIPVDVRVMAATSVDLEHHLTELTFRRDLYHRLSPITIQVPPLRERPEDIPVLVARLVEKLSRQFGRPIRLAPGARERLERYPFPGNITELESIVERATLHAASDPAGTRRGNGHSNRELVIKPEHLPLTVREWRPGQRHLMSSDPVRSLDESEQAAILVAGRAAGGNLSATARTLGIGRSTLWRKMKSLGLTAGDLRQP